ncbi:hypothetical protein RUM44_004727 [Polyplax serrata]|uniref:Uncharacterized protein n=1 Tax=Polyplax serrata TaxID=468196 RepID=A0ABR1B3M5_POLSC
MEMRKFVQLRQFKNLLLSLLPQKPNADQVKNGKRLFSSLPEVSEGSSRRRRHNDSFVVPALSPQRISEISTVTGVTIGICHVSWINVSVSPAVTVLEWNAKLLPEDFRKTTNEPELLKLAYSLKNSLPESDLYVMETFSMRGKELQERVNEIHLSSMLTVLLNGADMGWMDKVYFQKQAVLNRLYGLLIGSERVSCRVIMENLIGLTRFSEEMDSIIDKPFMNNSASIQIPPKYIDQYSDACLEKQEDLAIALLLTLSFLDVNIFKNTASLVRLKSRKATSA